jgi:PAS domain S-box-containing protein
MLRRNQKNSTRFNPNIRSKSDKPHKPTASRQHTPRRLSLSAARESHHWYRLIVDNVRDFAIFSADVNGNVSSWNPGAERFFGYQAEEILGKSIDFLYLPEDRAAGIPARERRTAVETGSSEDERWHIRKDGSRFFVFGRVNPMYTDQGELCGFIKIARDITPRKELQQRLESSEELHRLILQNIQDFAIFTIDTEAKIQTWNTGAENTYGYTAPEITGQSFEVLYAPEDRACGQPKKVLAAALKDAHVVEEHWCIRKDGRRIFVTGVLRPVRDHTGSIRGFCNVARDITSRRTMQEKLEHAHAELEQIIDQRTASLTEAVHELETFSYSLSHDMRAPLRAMEGFAEILQGHYSQHLPPEARSLLYRISEAAKRLDLLLKESLTYYRTPREPLPLQPTDLEPLLEALRSEHPDFRAEEFLTIRLPLHRVMAHPPSLTQALDNLLSNAIRFAHPDRKPSIHLRTEAVDGRVRIWIEDNGIGIAEKNQDGIWNLFTRLHPERFEGAGIGLAVVRKAIERMGGTVGVESQEGQGSRFWIELPATL